MRAGQLLFRWSLTAANLGTLKIDLHAVDDLLTQLDAAGLQIKTLGNFLDMLVHHGMEAAFGEDVDQHRQRQRVMKQGVFRIDLGSSRQGVTLHDGHEFALNDIHHADE